ncbi:hypothetical protein ACHHYP_20209 [Achlya hypogyna]|uniref:Uncharacterized protein n=1 Tax=Achlya hypogyna TaxID=1202772 RepID=A0A1V9YYB6_ACHHY|nr:hypothetical protein ACHHYP_20209 [Achlya hypogyna]
MLESKQQLADGGIASDQLLAKAEYIELPRQTLADEIAFFKSLLFDPIATLRLGAVFTPIPTDSFEVLERDASLFALVLRHRGVHCLASLRVIAFSRVNRAFQLVLKTTDSTMEYKVWWSFETFVDFALSLVAQHDTAVARKIVLETETDVQLFTWLRTEAPRRMYDMYTFETDLHRTSARVQSLLELLMRTHYYHWGFRINDHVVVYKGMPKATLL